MDENHIQEIWNKGKEARKMSKAEIQHVLRPRVRRSVFPLKMWIWLYLTVLAVVLILQGINIAGYWTNQTMLGVHIGLTLITLGFLGYGIYLAGALERLERVDEDLVTILRRRLRFYRTKYEVWLWMAAGACVLLAFAVISVIDNQDGHYYVNRPVVFVGVQIGMLLFLYGTFRLSHYPFMRESKALLKDLEHQVTEATEHFDTFKVKWRLWGAVAALILTALLVWGLLMALGS